MNSVRGKTRLIIETIDPRVPIAGGVDTCIRGLVKFAPDGSRLSIMGIDAVGDLALGCWSKLSIDGQEFDFMATARSSATADVRSIVPQSARFVLSLIAHRKAILGFQVIQSHRLIIGFVLRIIAPRSIHVQFYHNDGVRNLQAGSESYFRRLKFLYRYLERCAARGSSDFVIFNSGAADRLAKYSDTVRFCPTWFDDDHFYPSDLALEKRGTYRVLFVGRLDPSKDPLLALHAFLSSSCSDLEMTLVGDGSLRQQAEDLVREYGRQDSCQFVGTVAKSEVPDYMRTHDVLLVTSHYEGFSRSIVEALACGIPVVTTAGGEPNNLVVDGSNGCRVDTRSSIEIAGAINCSRKLLANHCVNSVADLKASVRVPITLGEFV